MIPPIVHLDTNFLVAVTIPDSSSYLQLIEWVAKGAVIQVSAMVWAEFQCGSKLGITPQEDSTARSFVGEILHVETSVAELAARLFNSTGRRSRSLADCIIAATAILADAPLATAHEDDFTIFIEHGLRLAN